MKDFVKVCKYLKMRSCITAINYCEKWESKIQKTKDAKNDTDGTASVLQGD